MKKADIFSRKRVLMTGPPGISCLKIWTAAREIQVQFRRNIYVGNLLRQVIRIRHELLLLANTRSTMGGESGPLLRVAPLSGRLGHTVRTSGPLTLTLSP